MNSQSPRSDSLHRLTILLGLSILLTGMGNSSALAAEPPTGLPKEHKIILIGLPNGAVQPNRRQCAESGSEQDSDLALPSQSSQIAPSTSSSSAAAKSVPNSQARRSSERASAANSAATGAGGFGRSGAAGGRSGGGVGGGAGGGGGGGGAGGGDEGNSPSEKKAKSQKERPNQSRTAPKSVQIQSSANLPQNNYIGPNPQGIGRIEIRIQPYPYQK